jgi:phosphate transport system permease protein
MNGVLHKPASRGPRGIAPLKHRSVARRKLGDSIIRILAWVAAAIGIFVMGWVLYTCIRRGAGAWSLDFFSKMPTPTGVPGGGILNAIVGTALITAMAAAMGLPVGFLAGVYLAEFGRTGRIATFIRIICNVLVGVPSILTGVFAYGLIVMVMGHFSAVAGAVALAVIMFPVITRTTEDILNLVPNELRESALAAGAPRWRVILGVVCRAARSGLLTGAILAVVRVSGETAPLLLTVLNSQFWSTDVTQPMANLTVTIYQYANSPYPDLQLKAWGASLFIIVGVLGANLLVRLIAQRGKEW